MHFMEIYSKSIINLLLCLLAADIVTSLRDVRVEIPNAVRRGEKAVLKCLYDLEGDTLYSVKWYKGRREFYSYTPKDTPAMKVFQFQGVKVNRSASNESQLVLDVANLATTGKYSCEVSADAPSFHTLISAGQLEVVEIPAKDPFISGIHSRYRVGDIVRGNCTSRHSKPAANLTWTVNGYETNPSHVRHHRASKESKELETAVSNIHFVITPSHFVTGKLKIRCAAHIYDVYWKSTEKSVEEDRHKHNSGQGINLVHSFSDDYFDMYDGNTIERTDTYMTHIKGDVSSLNANSATGRFCMNLTTTWSCLTIFTLLFCAMQQMLQLSRLFLCNNMNNNNKNNNSNSNTKAAATTTQNENKTTPKGITMRARAVLHANRGLCATTTTTNAMDIQIKRNNNNGSNSNKHNKDIKIASGKSGAYTTNRQHLRSGTRIANLRATFYANTGNALAAASNNVANETMWPETTNDSANAKAAHADTPTTATTTIGYAKRFAMELRAAECMATILLLAIVLLLLPQRLCVVERQRQIGGAAALQARTAAAGNEFLIARTIVSVRSASFINAQASTTNTNTNTNNGNDINNSLGDIAASQQQQQQQQQLTASTNNNT